MSITETLINPRRIDFDYERRVIAESHKTPPVTYPLVALYHHAAHATLRHQAVIHYISDNGNYADAAQGEIDVRLEDAGALLHTASGKPVPRIKYRDIPSQDTFAAAFDLAQFSRGAVRGFGNVYFANCAPRKKQRGVEDHNGGERVYAGILPNGAIIGGTGEEVFVHFKDLVSAGALNLYLLNVATNGTQFRSRDYFPWEPVIVAFYINRPTINRQWKNGLSTKQRDELLFGLNLIDREKKLEPHEIPDLPNGGAVVCRVDTHGNLKLGLRRDQLDPHFINDPNVIVYANGRSIRATLARNSFDKSNGVTALSGGSSGQWLDAGGKKLSPFTEIFTVGGRARDLLELSDRNIREGVEVHLIPANLFHQATSKFIDSPESSDTSHAAQFIRSGFVTGLNVARLAMAVRDGSVKEEHFNRM